MVSTAAKLSWKLGPTTASGQTSITAKPAGRAAACRQPLKPGRPREIVAARQHRRRGRHQPALDPHQRALARRRIVILQRDVETHPHHAAFRGAGRRIANRQNQPAAPVRRLLLTRQHHAGETGGHRARDRRGPGQCRLGPDRAAARRPGQREGSQRLAEIGPALVLAQQDQRRQRHAKAQRDQRGPLPGMRQGEPARDPAAEGHRQPGRAIEAGMREKMFKAVSDAGQGRPPAPRGLLQCSAHGPPESGCSRIALLGGQVGQCCIAAHGSDRTGSTG